MGSGALAAAGCALPQLPSDQDSLPLRARARLRPLVRTAPHAPNFTRRSSARSQRARASGRAGPSRLSDP
jgi:hypothetical protein